MLELKLDGRGQLRLGGRFVTADPVGEPFEIPVQSLAQARRRIRSERADAYCFLGTDGGQPVVQLYRTYAPPSFAG